MVSASRGRTLSARAFEAYRTLPAAQRASVWAIACVYGAFLPLTIVRAGVTRGAFGVLPVLWGLGIAAVTFALSVAVLSVSPPAIEPRKLEPSVLVLRYAAGPFAVFVVYLVAFYPALMSEDSYLQWHQVVTGRFNAFLPLVHTLLYWLAAQVWQSPAMLVWTQSALLALALGFSMATLARAGAPRRLLMWLTVASAAFPLSGLYAITIWKDILFSAALLWLTVTVSIVVRSEGSALSRPTVLVHLSLGLVAVSLLRPNGPAPALMTVVVLLVKYREKWRDLLEAAVAALGIILVVNVGLARATEESYEGWGFYSSSVFIYDIGAVLHEDLGPPRARSRAKPASKVDPEKFVVHLSEKVTRRERKTLAQFGDVNEWGRLYTPEQLPYWHTEHAHWERLDQPGKRSELAKVWKDIALRNPWVVLRHHLRVARIGWLVGADGYNASIYGRRAQSAELHMRVWNPVPRLTYTLARWVQATIDNDNLRPLTAHPALATYLSFLFFALFGIQRRSMGALAIATPLVVNWLATMAFCMAQDVRYFYSSFLVLPFALALPWTARNGLEPAQPPSAPPA